MSNLNALNSTWPKRPHARTGEPLGPSKKTPLSHDAQQRVDEGPQQLKKACAQLESLFIQQLFKEMRASVPKDGMFSGGKGEELYTEMLDAQVAKNLSSEKGVGLTDILYEQLSRHKKIK